MKPLKKTNQKKAWNKKTNIARTAFKSMPIRNLFLIFCEGENTEPEYFKSFPVTTETKVETIGLGMKRTRMVEEVIKRIKGTKNAKNQENYDPDRQIWCVFDMDVHYIDQEAEKQDFNNSIQLAAKHKIKVAYSNDAFELWFLLHHQLVESAITRKEYYEKLSEIWHINYEKERKKLDFAKSLYQKLLPNQSKAMKNAKKLFENQSHLPYCDQNLYTKVYELVEELNKCLKR